MNRRTMLQMSATALLLGPGCLSPQMNSAACASLASGCGRYAREAIAAVNQFTSKMVNERSPWQRVLGSTPEVAMQ